MQNDLDRFHALVDMAGKLGLTRLQEAWKALEAGVDSQPIRIVVLGEFNHGKSSLLNGLLGESVLPFGVTPTTQIDTYIRFGKPERTVRAYAGEEEIEHWTWEEWKKAHDVAERRDGCDRIEIDLDSQVFDENCIFIDTPGLNEAFLARESYLQRYGAHADLIVFVLDANQALTRAEQTVFEQLAVAIPPERRITVINKCDRLDEEEWLDICAYVETTLYPVYGEETLYMVSAKKKNVGDWDRLVERLHHGIESSRIGHREKYIERQNAEMQCILEGWMTIYHALENYPRAQLQKMGANEVSISVQEMGGILEKIEMDFARLERQTTCDLERFATAFQRAMPREIDKATLPSIEKYFEDFIDDTYAQNARMLIATIGDGLGRIWAGTLEKLTGNALHVDAGDFAFRFDEVEHWIANPPVTGAFDPSNSLGFWSLPLPALISEIAERPRREALRKMADSALACRATQYQQAFCDAIGRKKKVLATLVRECGMRMAAHLRGIAERAMRGGVLEVDL